LIQKNADPRARSGRLLAVTVTWRDGRFARRGHRARATEQSVSLSGQAHRAQGSDVHVPGRALERPVSGRFRVLLYDLTSTYFECDPPGDGKRKFGYSRDKRSDCVQVVIALI